jgi:two-component system nitrate/nitrite response regulator NarL
VLLVADECVRHGLTAMLDSLAMVDGVQLWGSPDFVPRASAPSRNREFDLLILRYGDLDAEATERLAQDAWDRGKKVLMLLNRDQEDCLDRIATIPSNGFIVQEDLTSASLAATITRVTHGETPMPAMLTDRLLTRARESGLRPPAAGSNLTPRERQVLELLVEGLINKQIARRLNISQHGVKRLVSNVLAKLNCPNRTQAVAVALTDGILADN